MAREEPKLSPSMENRDPQELNQHIRVTFEDVLGEPDGVRSIECVWVNSYKCFECSKNLCYRMITLFCGICFAMFWGCEFAMASFTQIWCWTPMMRDVSIQLGCLGNYFQVILNCCLTPVCESIGYIFSRIHINRT